MAVADGVGVALLELVVGSGLSPPPHISQPESSAAETTIHEKSSHDHCAAFPNVRENGKRYRMSIADNLIQPDRGQDAIAIHLVNKDSFEGFAKGLSGPQRAALAAQKFTGGGYQVAIVPDGEGWFAVGGVANPDELSSWCMAKLAEVLPAGTYRRA